MRMILTDSATKQFENAEKKVNALGRLGIYFNLLNNIYTKSDFDSFLSKINESEKRLGANPTKYEKAHMYRAIIESYSNFNWAASLPDEISCNLLIKNVERFIEEEKKYYEEHSEEISINQTKKVYISGPISGTKDFHDRFNKAERELKRLGFNVINPVSVFYSLPDWFSYEDIMTVDFALLRTCDTIYMLKNWKLSEGATRELEIAIGNGFKIMEQGVD